MFSGYDSDVAREKVVDYVTKIYSASIRNMSGTRPHLQHKELVVEDRYGHFGTPNTVITLLRYPNRLLGCPAQASCEPSGAPARQAAEEQHEQKEEGGGGGSRLLAPSSGCIFKLLLGFCNPQSISQSERAMPQQWDLVMSHWKLYLCIFIY